MKQGFEGKTAVVTGATRGIGHAIASRLISEGARVIGTGTSPQGKAMVPETCEFVEIDLSDTVATERLATSLEDEGIDILINNAGENRHVRVEDTTPEDFERLHNVNTTAPFLMCRSLIPGMRRRGWGRIVNVTSVFGIVTRERRGAYSASKFALDALTTTIAVESGADGVLANSVAPGFILTDLANGLLDEEAKAQLASEIPMGRWGRPEEVAALAVWLASPENTYVNGQNIAADGGFTRV